MNQFSACPHCGVNCCECDGVVKLLSMPLTAPASIVAWFVWQDAHAAYKDATIARLEREVEKFKVLARVAGDQARAGLKPAAGSLGSSFDASASNATQHPVEVQAAARVSNECDHFALINRSLCM